MTAAARKVFDEAVFLENSGDLDRALASFLKAQELSPEDPEISYRAAAALLQAGFLEEAQSQLRRLVFAEPDYLEARASLANCQFLLGDLSNSATNFKDVLKQDPDNPNGLYGLASVHLRDGKTAEALSLARRLATPPAPVPAPVLTLLADAQIRDAQPATAIASYRKALKCEPDFLPAPTRSCRGPCPREQI